MKKCIVSIVVIFSLGLLISGCGPQNYETTFDNQKALYYDVYNLDSTDSIFNDAMQNNPIDLAFSVDSTTAEDMVALQNKYLAIWQDELEYAITMYKKALTKEDAEVLDSIQSNFEKYINETFSFESRIIKQNAYNIHLGNASSFLLVSEKRETIRNRTIHIKYLHYLLESANQNSAEVSFYSLTFKYNTEEQNITQGD